MTTYELSNPHDKIFLDAEDFLDACCAALYVGEGMYGVHPVDGEGEQMPPFVLGGYEEWAARHGGSDAIVDRISTPGVIAALRSFRLVHGSRSSTCDPVGNAHRLAEQAFALQAAEARKAEALA